MGLQRHFVIPDRQCRQNVPNQHNLWIGKAIAKYKPDVVIDLGDGADFESISTHASPGSLSKEGLRLKSDIDAVNDAEKLLRKGMGTFRPKRMVRLRGNHEYRLTRFIEANPVLEGLVGLHLLDDKGWEVVPYLDGKPGIIKIHGIEYAHYFAQTKSPHAITGTIATRIAKVGGSFVQGHSQGLARGDFQYATGRVAYGIVAGSAYLHDEPYLGPANGAWRGVVVLNEVRGNGEFLDMPLSMDYLCRQFEGMSLARYMQRRYRDAKSRFSVARVT